MNVPLHPPATTVARLGLFAFFSVAALSAQTAEPKKTVPVKTEPVKTEPAKEVAQVLEKFEVTGSRVKRLDYETPAPVVTYTAEAISDKGYTTLGEFVQSLPFNSGTANAEFTTGSFIPGAVTSNPRGLGSNRFLTLVNGRRTVPYAFTNSANGTAQSVFNFNSVPAAAVDRLEFLKDGASAIYGSDAITGVYNIILKKNYSGTTSDFYVGNTFNHNSLNRRVSVFTGATMKGWDISVGVNYQGRHSNFIKDYGITTTDYRYLGPKGANFNSTINSPSYVQLSAAQAVTAGIGTATGYYLIPNGVGTANPTKASFVYLGTAAAAIPDSNRYNFARTQQFYPGSNALSGFVGVTRMLTPLVTGNVQLTYNHSVTRYVFNPFAFASNQDVVNGGTGFTLPATNPYNPFGFTLANNNSFTFRGLYMPERRYDITDNGATALASLKGTIRGNWNWETGVSYGTDKNDQLVDQLRTSDLQALLNGTTRTTALNPFGPSDNPAIFDNLAATSKGSNRVDAVSFDASLTGTLFQIPLRDAGEVSVATGFETRRATLRSNPDTALYLGVTSGGVPFRGKRYTDSYFAEFSLPLQKWLEVQVAARHEEYSDFGQTTKPKFGGKIRLPNNKFVNVLLRGSYSKSFKAPDLGQLFQGQTQAITSGTFSDPLRPQDGARQIRAVLGGNPDLKPEEGKVQYAGAVFEIPAVKGLSFNADYFDIRIANVITTLGLTYLLSEKGRLQFPNAVVRDNSTQNPGPILFYSGLSNNLGYTLYRGWDFGMKYSLRNTRFGSFTLSVDATNIVKRGSDAGQGAGFFNNTGLYLDVEWRTNVFVNWRHKNWSAAATADITGKFFNDSRTAAGWGENPYTVISPSITYRGFRKLQVTVGSANVLDKLPPPNGFVVSGFDNRAYGAGALGRTLYVRVRKDY